jgi:hypothetical protein
LAANPKLNFGGAGASFFSSGVVGGFTPNGELVFVDEGSGPSAPLNDELVITGAVVGLVVAPKLNFKGPGGGAVVVEDDAEDDEAA